MYQRFSNSSIMSNFGLPKPSLNPFSARFFRMKWLQNVIQYLW